MPLPRTCTAIQSERRFRCGNFQIGAAGTTSTRRTKCSRLLAQSRHVPDGRRAKVWRFAMFTDRCRRMLAVAVLTSNQTPHVALPARVQSRCVPNMHAAPIALASRHLLACSSAPAPTRTADDYLFLLPRPFMALPSSRRRPRWRRNAEREDNDKCTQLIRIPSPVADRPQASLVHGADRAASASRVRPSRYPLCGESILAVSASSSTISRSR